MRRVTGFGVLAAAVVCMGPSAGAAANPIRTSVTVVGAAPVVADLRACLTERLARTPGYLLVDRLPTVGLVVFANTDTNDDVNTKGVSLAIAHVNHVDAMQLASKLLLGPDPTEDADVQAAVTELLGSGGVLDRLNVAHMGTPTRQATQDLCASIAAEFFTKYPATGAE